MNEMNKYKSTAKPIIKSGMSAMSLLGIAFIILKLTNIIDWHWFFVTLPFTFIPLVVIVALLSFGITYLIIRNIRLLNKKRKRGSV